MERPPPRRLPQPSPVHRHSSLRSARALLDQGPDSMGPDPISRRGIDSQDQPRRTAGANLRRTPEEVTPPGPWVLGFDR